MRQLFTAVCKDKNHRSDFLIDYVIQEFLIYICVMLRIKCTPMTRVFLF